ncbi:MAG TPA: pseudouridine synthase [Bacillota bacterium]
MAAAGVASRRAAEAVIRSGRVRVDGRVVSDPAARCDPDRQRVEVDGRRIAWPPRRVVVALHKPAGYVTTRSDPRIRHTIYDLLRGAPAGLHPIGRLDAASRGLLLLTNDGSLTQRLMRPAGHVPRVYRVRVRGLPEPRVLEALRQGVPLADGRTRPAGVRVIAHDAAAGTADLELTLYEGRNRQIRRMMATVGHPVLDLERVRVGPIGLGDLAEGRWRRLTPAEVRRLERAAAGHDPAGGPTERNARDRGAGRNPGGRGNQKLGR